MFFLLAISFFAVSRGISLDAETRCSRFHYEEQLLEKMIRMEIKVEEIEKRISKTDQNVIDALEVIKTESKRINAENNELQMNFSRKMEEKIAYMSDLKASLFTETIAFKARGPVDLSPATGQIIIFAADIMLNKGEAYNKNTGIFTAPVSGTYIFMIHLCLINNNSMHYGIMVDDTLYTAGKFLDLNAYSCYTADALLVLSGGERIYVRCLSGSSNNVMYEKSTSTTKYWNTFSGLLVHR